MNRRRYLTSTSAVTLGVLSGCASISREVKDFRAAQGFSFPEGLSRNGVEDARKVFWGHVAALETRTYHGEFSKHSELFPNEVNRIRCSGTPNYSRWDIKYEDTPYTHLYIDKSIRYAGTEADETKPTQLHVGEPSGRGAFLRWLMNGVGNQFRDALKLPFGAGDFSVRRDGETKVAVFETKSHPNFEIERLRLAVGEDGIIRQIDARVTPKRKKSASEQQRGYKYAIELGADPPAERAGYPEGVTEFPTFGVDWQQNGRVMALTNTGGRPVSGAGRNELAVDGLTLGGTAWGSLVKFRTTLPPGETRYLWADNGAVLTDSPPNDAPVLKTDDTPSFLYQNPGEDGGPYRLEYSAACSELQC